MYSAYPSRIIEKPRFAGAGVRKWPMAAELSDATVVTISDTPDVLPT
jgi:hypothetical protein